MTCGSGGAISVWVNVMECAYGGIISSLTDGKTGIVMSCYGSKYGYYQYLDKFFKKRLTDKTYFTKMFGFLFFTAIF